LAMGYGARRRDLSRHVGKSGDGGIDAIITQDELGLDSIFVQAKRLRPSTTVPVADVRDFAGSLEAMHATKGIFVSTAQFSDPARTFVAALTRRVVLNDGAKLTDLMIRHNLGVTIRQTYLIKDIEPGYFARPGRRKETTSAETSPSG
jgi:restriction system protein